MSTTSNDSIRDSQREIKLLAGATDEGIAIAEEGVITELNVALTRLLGYEPGDLIGMQLDTLCTPETWRSFQAKVRAGSDQPAQGWARRKDGSPIPVQVNGRKFEFEGRTVVVVTFGDLTQLRITEEKLRQSEHRYRSLFNAMLHGFALCEMDLDGEGKPLGGRIVETNPAFTAIFGAPDKKAASSGAGQERPAFEQRWLDLYCEVRATGEPVRQERYFPELDKFIEVVAFSPEEGTLAAIMADVTERRRLEAKLRQAAKMEAIGTLASGVAHEINNPINVIMNYAGLILRATTSREDTETFAREIVNESERIATIVRNLLAFARQEQEVNSQAKMSDVVRATLSLMRKVLDNDQIATSVDVPADLPPIRCRRHQIEQVVVNLVTNARHALNERYPGYDENKRLSLSASVVERDGRRWVRTVVEDQGPGIPPEVVDRIFDPFFTTKTGGGGTGLGLSVSQGIVEDHHGGLTVESELGRFTRFNLDLPVYDPDEDWPAELGLQTSFHAKEPALR